MTDYKNFDDMPACLNISEVAQIMRVSTPVVYAMVHRDDFPAVKVGGKRYVVPKDRFIRWLENANA